MIKLFKEHWIIRAYHPTFSSRFKRFFQTNRSGPERSGLYTLGQGDKAVVWYWEFNMDSMEYYDFLTLDLKTAMTIYEACKYDMWSYDWTPPPL